VEVQGWVNLLDSGVSPLQVAQAFTNSPEFRANLIDLDFQTFLQRRPGFTETAVFLNGFQGGLNDELLEANILGSAEFFHLHGANNLTWLTATYQGVLGRSPDPVGLNFWNIALATGVPRTTVALDIVHSAEAHARVVASLYPQLLLRTADFAGAQFWNSLLNHGLLTPTGLVASLAASNEFIARTSAGGLDIRFGSPVAVVPSPVIGSVLGQSAAVLNPVTTGFGNAFVVNPFGPVATSGPSFGFSPFVFTPLGFSPISGAFIL
jgi:hypothetical protein